MKIQGKFPADVVGFCIKRNQAHDGREAFVDIEVGVERQEAAARFGEEFETLAFATLFVREDEDGSKSETFLVDTIKPNKRVVFERHVIELEKKRIETQPELLSISTVDGYPKVVAKIRLPIDVSKADLINDLVQKVGKTISTEFNPEQAGFAFEVKKGGKGKKDAAAEAPAAS